MKRLVGLLAFIASLWAVPALAAPVIVPGTGTGGTLGFANNATGQTLGVGTTADCAAGDWLVGYAEIASSTRSVSSVADNATGGSNTYTVQTTTAFSTYGAGAYFSSLLTHDLPNTGTVTVTFSASTTVAKQAVVVCFSGMTNTSDITGTGANDGGTATNKPTYPTGTLAQASEVAIGLAMWNSNTGSVNSASTGWTGLETINGTSANSIYLEYKITTGTSALTFQPTLSANEHWGANVSTWKATGGGGSVTPKGTLMGVGP